MYPMSVHMGYDGEVIDKLLRVHHPAERPRILDVTCNRGTIWTRSKHKPCVRTDLKPHGQAMADFRALPFASGSFDVVVFDPPHLPAAQDSEHGSSLWKDRYGIDRENADLHSDNVSGLFPAALKEMGRVVDSADGVVLVKIADLVHNHHYQWQHVDLIIAVRELGFTACDMIINVHPSAGRLQSSKWKNVRHMRKSHVYWIVVRPNQRCEARAGMKVWKPQTLSLFAAVGGA